MSDLLLSWRAPVVVVAAATGGSLGVSSGVAIVVVFDGPNARACEDAGSQVSSVFGDRFSSLLTMRSIRVEI